MTVRLCSAPWYSPSFRDCWISQPYPILPFLLGIYHSPQRPAALFAKVSEKRDLSRTPSGSDSITYGSVFPMSSLIEIRSELRNIILRIVPIPI